MRSEEFEPLNQDEVDAVECEVMDSGAGCESDSRASAKEFIGAEKCAGICAALSDIFASRKGDKWKLKQEESDQLGAALDPVLVKYLPADGDDISAELGLAIVAIAILAPRVGAGDEK